MCSSWCGIFVRVIRDVTGANRRNAGHGEINRVNGMPCNLKSISWNHRREQGKIQHMSMYLPHENPIAFQMPRRDPEYIAWLKCPFQRRQWEN